MNMRNALIASIVLNIMLVALIFMVKKNATDQAQTYVKKVNSAAVKVVGDLKDKYENNTLLWSMALELQSGSDQSKAAVKRLANSKKLPRCNGKACDGDQARLAVDISNVAGKKSAKVGWGGYSFLVKYDDADKFIGIDASGMLETVNGAEEPALVEEAP